MPQGWVCSLSAVSATGDVTQLYPANCTAGVAKSSSSNGQLIRRPLQGALHSIQLETDGTNAGTIQIYDIDGGAWGADVSSATTITNTQLSAAISAGKAQLIFEQNFAGTPGSGIVNAPGVYREFLHGLAARMVNAGPTGTCKLNLVVGGGYEKVESRGGY